MKKLTVLAAALLAAAGCARQSADSRAMNAPESMEKAVQASLDDPATREQALATAEKLATTLEGWANERQLLAAEQWDLFSDYRTTRDGFTSFYKTAAERRSQTWTQLIDAAMEARSVMSVDEWYTMYENLEK